MSIYTKSAMILSLSGAALVSGLYPLYGNIAWIFSGIIWSVHFYKIKETDAAIVQYLFTLIAWWGVCNWYTVV